jgi:leucyl aminopeptidase
MFVYPAESSTVYNHKIYLFTDFSQLKDLNLSPEEESYVKDKLNEAGSLLLTRLPEQLFLVRIKEDPNSAILAENLRIAGHQLCSTLNHAKAENAWLESLDPELPTHPFAEGLALSNYQFLKYFTKEGVKPNSLKSVYLTQASNEDLQKLNAVIEGTYLARNLVNEPLHFLTAAQLAEEAKKAAAKYGFNIEVFNKKKIESLKMGGLLAVNRGSQDPPTFSILEYNAEGATNQKPFVLVGKGVVYDTGGLSLKPTAGSMDSMKSDMAGAAAVIGAISAIAAAKLPLNVIGLIPATDNRPGEKAYVPGDVVTMYDGSTVEVLNTDAEGRMLLADALAYAKHYQPELVIDLATLTGAAAVAIGKYGVVSMGTADENTFSALEEAGRSSYERVARFPFWDEYSELLKSDIADQKNIGGREAGAITAGKFLEVFTDYPWMHIDIAGPAYLSSNHHYRPKGGTGVGVRLLLEFLKAKASK